MLSKNLLQNRPAHRYNLIYNGVGEKWETGVEISDRIPPNKLSLNQITHCLAVLANLGYIERKKVFDGFGRKMCLWRRTYAERIDTRGVTLLGLLHEDIKREPMKKEDEG